MVNAFTIDVEDYYSVFSRDRLDIDGPPTDTVVVNTQRMLEMLAEHGVHATFFILGEVAEAFPQLVRDISSGGHEIGVHGYKHRQLFKLTRRQFTREVGDAAKRLGDLCGGAMAGHRAPAFSIGPDTQWGLEALAELGFSYDSSIYPISGKRYGWPGFQQGIHEMRLPNGTTIIEAPLSTVRILGRQLPACGGGYMRHFPYWFTRLSMRAIQRVRPAIVYMHPYEIDTSSGSSEFDSALAAASKQVRRFHAIQLRNRQTVEPKLSRLLKEFQFAPLGEVISKVLPTQSSPAV